MATVYRAFDRRLDRVVALKVMHAHLAESSDFVARFRREARAAARLSNPGVVSVYDQGSLEGVAYLVMEFVEGPTLRNLIAAGPLSVSEALTLTSQVLHPLAAAHRAGLVHRDVKPENVLLPADGSVAKVADFGLARAVTETTQTTTGNVLGTAAYLAPELITSGESSARADIFSVGVILYEMLTGVPPFRGETPIHIAFCNVHQDVPAPSKVVEGLPELVDELVAKLTARDPSARPGDADAALAELRGVSSALSDQEMSVRREGGVVPVVGYGQDLVARALALAPPSGDDPDAEPSPRAQALAPAPAPPANAEAAGEPAEEPVGRRTVSLPVGAIGPLGTTRLQTQRPQATSVLTPGAMAQGAPSQQGWQPGAPQQTAAQRARSRQQPHLARRAAIGAGLVALLGAGGAGAWYLTVGPGAGVSVPEVTGLSEAEAERLVREAGLEWQRGDEAHSDTVEAGLVISTTPAPGERVSQGTVLTAVVSLGVAQATVPKVVGHTRAEASQLLKDAGLKVGAVTESYSDSVEVGKVISSDPAAGATINHSSAVAMVISKGRQPATVPDVVGQTRDSATTALNDAGLKVGTVTEEFSEVEAGKVLSSDPSAGASDVYRGDEVSLVVSKGPQMVTLPDVSSLDEEEAKKTLEDLGLKVEVLVVRRPLFIFRDVEGTDPAAYTSVRAGSTVKLRVFD